MARHAGRQPSFDREKVVDVALGQGLDRFTLASVAKELGVSAPSLYRVVRSRDELVDLGLKRVGSAMVDPDRPLGELPEGTPRWRALLERYRDDFWALLASYPGFATTIATTPGAHAHAQRYLQRLLGAVSRAGFPGTDPDIEFLLDFIGDLVLSTFLMTEPMREVGEDGLTGLQRARRALEAAGGDPLLLVRDDWAERGNLDAKVAFVLDAVEAALRPRD